MRIAHTPEFFDTLRTPTPDDPLRILVSGCLAAWPCGIDGTDYGLGQVLPDLLALPVVRAIPFCPEDHGIGTPRNMPDIHGGDGHDVLDGTARVLDEHGADLTAGMVKGARAMAAHAVAERAELAILTDMSAACGTQVISDGCRYTRDRSDAALAVEARGFRASVGVAAAAVIRAGIPVVAQRDARTLERLRHHLDPRHEVDSTAVDWHEVPWYRETFG